MARVYLDVCCLNRPFDDQGQERIRLETEAVLLVMARIRAREAEWVSSDAVQAELSVGPVRQRRAWIEELLEATNESVPVTAEEASRAEELTSHGFRALDALHIAWVEAGRADVFLTTDDELLRAARRPSAELHVRVANPVTWIQEGLK